MNIIHLAPLHDRPLATFCGRRPSWHLSYLVAPRQTWLREQWRGARRCRVCVKLLLAQHRPRDRSGATSDWAGP